MIAEVLIDPIDNNNGYTIESIDATPYLAGNGAISNIKQSVDAADFVVGLFSYSHTKIKLKNIEGIFSYDGYSRYFPYGRDESRVRIRLRNPDNNQTFPIFTGLISDDATMEDDINEIISFTVLSYDSIFKHDRVPSGTVGGDLSYKDALIKLIDRNPINLFVSIEEDNLTLDYNGVIEDGEAFTGLSVSDAVNKILLSANSIMFVDENRNVIADVRTSRKTQQEIFYGPYSEVQRTPLILGIKKINNGHHRMINQVQLNEVYYEDVTYIDAYKLKSKTLDLKFITTSPERSRVANNIIKRHRYPKPEMTIIVPTISSYDLSLVDLVSVDYERLVSSARGDDVFARYDIAEYDDGEYPGEHGTIYISPEIGWIVYEISHNLSDFTTELKLKEFGSTSGDSVLYDVPNEYDRAVYDTGLYESDDGVVYASSVGYYDNSDYYVGEYE